MTNVIEQENGQVTTPARGIWGWMLFDWAAQPFFTVVTTFIFGPYFVSRLTEDPIGAQVIWGNVATVSSLIIAVLSPVLGSIADKSGSRKPWICLFAAVKITCLALLWFAAPGSPAVYPALFMILASIAAEFSVVFNDSMMPHVIDRKNVGRVSNIAWGLGYLGGMVVLIFIVGFVSANPQTGLTLLGRPPVFGLDVATGEDARISGPISALWYLVFLLPMLLFTPDVKKGLPLAAAVKSGLVQLKYTLDELCRRRAIRRFLIARMIYQDGVNGLILLGGVFAAAMFGWPTLEIGIYGIIINVVAIFGCIVAGALDRRVGSKTMILVSLSLLIFATLGLASIGRDYMLFGLMALSVQDSGSFFGTAAEKAYIGFGVIIGLAFGPVQASSRSYLARSISISDSGRYFGLYALSGRATSFMATMMFSTVTYATGSAHWGMATLILFLAGGMILLVKTPYPANDVTEI